MAVSVSFDDRADAVLAAAGTFLASRPVVHNLVLSLLHDRARSSAAGRYWTVADGDDVVGVVFHSPMALPATITRMPLAAVAAVVGAISDAGVALPGVMGEAATAARFAGEWTERHTGGAVPVDGMRLYEVEHLEAPTSVTGRLRAAEPADHDVITDWLGRFLVESGEPSPGDVGAVVDARIRAGHFSIWDDGGPASMAALTPPVESVARIQAVYTPDERRRHGYAGATVAALSTRVLGSGHRAILYTDLSNPGSNSIYRRLGYRAVAECLRYRFT